MVFWPYLGMVASFHWERCGILRNENILIFLTHLSQAAPLSSLKTSSIQFSIIKKQITLSQGLCKVWKGEEGCMLDTSELSRNAVSQCYAIITPRHCYWKLSDLLPFELTGFQVLTLDFSEQVFWWWCWQYSVIPGYTILQKQWFCYRVGEIVWSLFVLRLFRPKETPCFIWTVPTMTTTRVQSSNRNSKSWYLYHALFMFCRVQFAPCKVARLLPPDSVRCIKKSSSDK